MNSVSTPFTHVGQTRTDLTLEFGPGKLKNQVTVPAGTRVVKLDGGTTPWVVDDLNFIEDKSSMAYHDADHYGIHVSFQDVINVREK
ncbi:hypothetical protein EFK68_04095 [Pseudomonas aeruginosa]|uniref:hypothetical protein n=1 Tax=Pseudomonas aeruginosa TaxID=287 RepID=UPI0009397077|nr:hypothetical protein [Pseudomonas aeruginosa]EKF7417631.1 hypothetical protein [Pseudomonas aeruginosa]RNF58554.1 hypothetical protein EFK68_04095 [Pseudomonas aeruginosa]HBO1619795.1 hypothetical protein [Pseudomonas aeruginosa]